METDITFILNKEIVKTRVNPSTVLLDFIRKNQKLTGTKEVCKEGDCGACAILLGEYENGYVRYKTINSCLYPILKVSGKHILTIEGLNGASLNPIQQAFLNQGASQCGFCTPGFIVSLTGYLLNSKIFKIDDAINAIAGNICRCTGYHSIIRAVNEIGEVFLEIDEKILVENGILPSYFMEIPDRLRALTSNSNQGVSTAMNSQLISGGTDLFVQKPDSLLETKIDLVENIIDPAIKLQDNQIYISGSATLQDLEAFLKANLKRLDFNKLFELFASLPIRNSATIAGNIINASPIADITISLLSLDSELILKNNVGNERIVALKDFYKGYKELDKKENELLVWIRFNIPSQNSKYNFEKVSKRRHMDIASVNSAICIELEENIIRGARISAGGVAPIPLYLRKTSEYMIGKKIHDDLFISFSDLIFSEISPISDIRGSAEYKSLLLQQLIKAHFLELFPNKISSKVVN